MKITCSLRSYHLRSKAQLFSNIFRPVTAVPKEKVESPTSCRSLKLMLKNGLITPSSSGIFNLMPVAVIAVEKLCTLIDYFMKTVGGQKMLFPTLTQSSLWKMSGRWDGETSHLFKLKDRHHSEYCLGPTHEEAVTSMVASSPLPLRSLPLRLYQISSKFRDEINPKLGLLRGREFLMKDMYTFDVTEENAKTSYSEVCDAYDKFFQTLGIQYVKVLASSAGMGGSHSHEYHFLADTGEDEILFCPNCKTGLNVEVASADDKNCTQCDSKLHKSHAIEVGHAFLLGEAYSEPFKAVFKSSEGTFKILQMGCYGLGVTRILAASIECLAEGENIRWPLAIAPYLLSIIPPKKGSKEDSASYFASYLLHTLSNISYLSDAIVFDDRTNLTIGKRVQESNALGIPFSVVTASTVQKDVPEIEVIDNYNGKTYFLTHLEVMRFFGNFSRTLYCKYDNKNYDYDK